MEEIDFSKVSQKFSQFFEAKKHAKMLENAKEKEKMKFICKQITDAYKKTILQIYEEIEKPQNEKNPNSVTLQNITPKNIDLRKINLKKSFYFKDCEDLIELEQKLKNNKIPIRNNDFNSDTHSITTYHTHITLVPSVLLNTFYIAVRLHMGKFEEHHVSSGIIY